MKVLWFTNTPALADEYLDIKIVRGGWLKSLNKHLQGKVELSIAFYYPKTSEPFRYQNTTFFPIGKKNWKREVIKNRILGRDGFIDDEDIDKYLHIIETVNPDIIHIHGTENPFGIIARRVNLHTPVIVSIQGILTVYAKKFKADFDWKELKNSFFTLNTNINLKKVLTQSSILSAYKNFIKKSKREQRNLAKSVYILGRTDWDRRVSKVLSPGSVYFHSNEILRDVFYQEEWRATSGKLVIHSTTGSSLFKGFETICEALLLLIKHPQYTEITWQVAGISEQDHIVALVKKRMGQNYPSKHLRLLGSLNEQQLVNAMKKATVFVMASHIENSPNNLCEAMILGMPCVATYAGGTGSLLKDGEEGILIQDGDPWAMAGAILELLEDKKKAVTYGKNARTRALYRHEPERIVAELIDTYQIILKTKKN